MKRRHKKLLKQKFLRANGCYTNEHLYMEEDHPWKNDPRNGGFIYWQNWMDNVHRKRYIRNQNDRRLRAMYAGLLAAAGRAVNMPDELEDLVDEIQAMRNGDYRRAFEYWWEVW